MPTATQIPFENSQVPDDVWANVARLIALGSAPAANAPPAALDAALARLRRDAEKSRREGDVFMANIGMQAAELLAQGDLHGPSLSPAQLAACDDRTDSTNLGHCGSVDPGTLADYNARVGAAWEGREVRASHRKGCTDCGYTGWSKGESYFLNEVETMESVYGGEKLCETCMAIRATR